MSATIGLAATLLLPHQTLTAVSVQEASARGIVLGNAVSRFCSVSLGIEAGYFVIIFFSTHSSQNKTWS